MSQSDPIETVTIWLDFGEQGECAISADLTRYKATLERIRRANHR